MWIDAHCHLTSKRFSDDLEAVLNRSCAVGVGGWLLGGVDRDEWLQQKLLRARLGARVLPTFGVHPWRVGEMPELELKKNIAYLESVGAEAFAIGELGLDFGPRLSAETRPLQKALFTRQLEIARELKKPIILHVVGAHPEVLGELKRLAPKANGGHWRGLVHAFQGDLACARAYRDLGLTISIGGACTRTGQHELRAALAQLSLSDFVVESDAPDQVPYRYSPPQAKRNEPCVLPWLAEKIAELRGETPDLVLESSRRNLEQILGITFDAALFQPGNFTS